MLAYIISIGLCNDDIIDLPTVDHELVNSPGASWGWSLAVSAADQIDQLREGKVHC